MLQLLLYDYQRTTRCYTIYRTFKQWSSDDFTTICREKLRLLATTIDDLYWLSGESPKRDAAGAANGSAPPAAGRGKHRDPAGLTPQRVRRRWHGLPSYIPYYNRRSVLTCTASLRGGGVWYRLSVSGRVYALQRVAGGIIAACVGLLSWAVERVQSQETPI